MQGTLEMDPACNKREKSHNEEILASLEPEVRAKIQKILGEARAAVVQAKEGAEGARAAAAQAKNGAKGTRAAATQAKKKAAGARAAAKMLSHNITFSELLDSSLPPIDDCSSLKSSSTKAVGEMAPEQVLFWDLEEEMVEFRSSLLQETLQLPAKKMTRPGMNRHFEVVHESQTQAFFVETAGSALKLLCGLMDRQIFVTATCGFQCGQRDKPDVFCIREADNLPIAC